MFSLFYKENNQSNILKAGFTLIELSIVLVIIGLITGGILAGRDLIKAAEIRSQISQIEKYNAAVRTFQLKYDGIPGDLLYTKAQAFGLYTITYAPYIGYAGYGNGDGLIRSGEGATNNLTANYTALLGEPLMFWRQLSDANLIDGSYGKNLNIAAESTTTSSSDYLPLAKIGKGATIEINSLSDMQNYFLLTKRSLAPFASNPLTASEAYSIDQKIDDGLPATGGIIAIDGTGNLDSGTTWTTVSAVSGCVASSAYAVTQTTQSCSLRFKFQ
jgi:prepilin-type N-terminal cleavage/methylation domain-containing protein